MYQTLVQLHSIGRWIVLLFLLIAIFRSVSAGNTLYTIRDKRIGLLLTGFSDLMLLTGIYLWFAGPWGYKQIEAVGMGGTMKNPVTRFYGIEHLVGMLIAIILIHIGKAQGKKAIPDKTKHRKSALYYILALIIILASIPWPFRESGAGRGWF